MTDTAIDREGRYDALEALSSDPYQRPALDRAIRRTRDALPGATDAEVRRIATLDLAIRTTMGEPR